MIVFCHLLNDNSGSPVVLREAIRALAGEGDTLFVGSQGRGVLEEAGVPIRRYWYRRSRFRPVTLVTFALSQLFLYRALARARLPQDAVIYANTLLPFGAALWARRNGRALLTHVHETSISPAPLKRFLVGIVEKTAGRVLYVSEDNRTRLPIRDVPSAVVANPVSEAIGEAGRTTPYVPRRSGAFNALMLASPRDFKGIPEFLDLARHLSARPDIRFTLVLNGEPEDVARYLPPEDVPANVAVHSRTAEPQRFYAKADVLLNLSRVDQWIETFGMTIIEGMAFGLPTIVPPVGGPAEIVTDGREGVLVDSRDGDALERAVLALADAPDKAQAMSDAARSRADDYTAARFAADLRAQIALLPSASETGKVRR